MLEVPEKSPIEQWKDIRERVAQTSSRPKVLSGSYLPEDSSIAIKTAIESELINTNDSRVGIISIDGGDGLNFYRFKDSQKEVLELNSIPQDVSYIFFSGSVGYAEIFLPRNNEDELLISPHYSPLGANSEVALAQKIYNTAAIEDLAMINPKLAAQIREIKGSTKVERTKKTLLLTNLNEFDRLVHLTAEQYSNSRVFIQLKDDFRNYLENRISMLRISDDKFFRINNGIGQTIILIIPIEIAKDIFKIDQNNS